MIETPIAKLPAATQGLKRSPVSSNKRGRLSYCQCNGHPLTTIGEGDLEP